MKLVNKTTEAELDIGNPSLEGFLADRNMRLILKYRTTGKAEEVTESLRKFSPMEISVAYGCGFVDEKERFTTLHVNCPAGNYLLRGDSE